MKNRSWTLFDLYDERGLAGGKGARGSDFGSSVSLSRRSGCGCLVSADIWVVPWPEQTGFVSVPECEFAWVRILRRCARVNRRASVPYAEIIALGASENRLESSAHHTNLCIWGVYLIGAQLHWHDESTPINHAAAGLLFDFAHFLPGEKQSHFWKIYLAFYFAVAHHKCVLVLFFC